MEVLVEVLVEVVVVGFLEVLVGLVEMICG